MATRILLRRDTSANWASANTVIANGEIGYDTTLDRIKVGDGSTAWASLPFTTNVDIASNANAGLLSASDKAKLDGLHMPISFHISGALTAGVQLPRFISPVACTLSTARAYAGGGSGVTYRLVKNGSTNGNTSATVGSAVVTTSLSTVTSLAVGDTLQVEIVSAGTSGADLSVTVSAAY